ncbi:MAG: AAA family ATPase [Gammaproteobacteria bacterium]|nr:AAA family ATPase [Gammaproteobacteria bacterium]
MITKIYIDNFKSLAGFRMPMAKFVCLIGLNGAGKSTILQALDFLARLAAGRLDEWLAAREWDKKEINSKLTRKSNIAFEVHFDLRQTRLVWKGEFYWGKLYCSSETVMLDDRPLLQVGKGIYIIHSRTIRKVNFQYQGSILSQLKASELTEELREVKEFLMAMKSMELLSPHLLRQAARGADADLGRGGEKLSGFLHKLPADAKEWIVEQLRTLYPYFDAYEIRTLRNGWKKLSIKERFSPVWQKNMETEAQHINDGLLRMLALLAQIRTAHSFLMFDEIENGINPELVEQLVKILLNGPQQMLVTTHSPMILNYLEDEQAKESVLFIYKTPQGYTRAKRFFEIPRLKEKLLEMGPGEAFVDTCLGEVAEELCAGKATDSEE